MIVVTGATGALNGATVRHLLDRIPAERIGISVRDVAKAQDFAARGVRVRRGSYEDPAALRESFAGAEQVLLVSGNDPTADMLALHRNAIEAAVAAGVQRILYTSQQGAAADSPYTPAHVHAATEAILAGTGVSWTALRYGFFGNPHYLLGPWRQTGVITGPADGPVPWVDRGDIAEGAAVILAGDRSFDGPVTLSAPHAVTLDDFAAIASEVSGRRIERIVVDDAQWLEEQVAAGMPEHMARMSLTLFQAARTGIFAATDPLLTDLLGRTPRSAADQLEAALGEQ